MATGAGITLKTLIGLRYRANGIDLAHRSKALSLLSGKSKASFRGRGLDFEEVRHYQPGDEPRAIDWRVTARTGQPHTKLFSEERERPTFLVVDQGNSMGFGTRNCFKSVQAAEMAALLGWASLYNHDRVGGLVVNDNHHREIRPKNSRKTLLGFFKILSQFNQQLILENTDFSEGTSSSSGAIVPDRIRPVSPVPPGGTRRTSGRFYTIANELRRIARPGTAVYIISDFIGIDEAVIRELLQVRRHCDITAIQVSDPMEQELPAIQRAWFTDGKERLRLNLRNQSLLEEYKQDFSGFQTWLARQFSSTGIPLINASTTDDAQQLLEYYYNPRTRLVRA